MWVFLMVALKDFDKVDEKAEKKELEMVALSEVGMVI